MRRLFSIPGLAITLFFAWKVALLLATSQPVPSNDAFFYDGPVVNYLLHGKYCNPSLAQVLPISGTEVFSAYPPLHQAVLLGWMKCFGPGVLASMWYHIVLLAGFALTIYAVFRELKLPASAINLAGLFLFGITFHDRPDTLAHFLGATTVLATIRGWFWPAAVFLLLTFMTSLQIGGIYSLWVAGLIFGSARFHQGKVPTPVIFTFSATCCALILLVKLRHPLLWAGFREHVSITPSFTGLRLPRLDDMLKIIRTTPGIAVAATGLLVLFATDRQSSGPVAMGRERLVCLAATVAAFALIGGCLFILTPNTIHIASYLQPVIVASFLGAWTKRFTGPKWFWAVQLPLLAATLLVSIRAIGMSTWGILCARDISYTEATTRLTEELNSLPDQSLVFASGPYLNQIAARTNLTGIHADWPAPARGRDWELRAIEHLRPARLFLTQFDYYRRFEPVLAQFRRDHGDVEVDIEHLTRVQPPDAIPHTRKMVQNISWAPVLVRFTWPANSGSALPPISAPAGRLIRE